MTPVVVAICCAFPCWCIGARDAAGVSARPRSRPGSAPELADQSDAREVRGGLAWFPSTVSRVEPARVPPRGEPPEGGEVEHGATLVARAIEPPVDAFRTAKDALVLAAPGRGIPYWRKCAGARTRARRRPTRGPSA